MIAMHSINSQHVGKSRCLPVMMFCVDEDLAGEIRKAMATMRRETLTVLRPWVLASRLKGVDTEKCIGGKVYTLEVSSSSKEEYEKRIVSINEPSEVAIA